MSESLRPHESQQSRPPCPSPAPGVYSSSCPSSWWCHPANPSSVVPFSSCPQSLPASGSFPMSQLFESNFGVSKGKVSGEREEGRTGKKIRDKGREKLGEWRSNMSGLEARIRVTVAGIDGSPRLLGVFAHYQRQWEEVWREDKKKMGSVNIL